MADFEWRKFGDFSEDRIERLKETATRSIDDFTVSFVLGDELWGSGTLVDVSGTLGILTAFHVARDLVRHGDRDLAMIIARHFHRFDLPRECFEHVPIGTPTRGEEQGPDLSFLHLFESPALATIKSKKSFYRIREKPLGELEQLPLENLFWWIAGAPASRASRGGPKSRQGALNIIHLVGQANFVRLVAGEDDFDILTLSINSGEPPFAMDYGGCSGGGVWASALAKDPAIGDESLDISPALLAGVIYYQSPEIDRRRDILANGPGSLTKIALR